MKSINEIIILLQLKCDVHECKNLKKNVLKQTMCKVKRDNWTIGLEESNLFLPRDTFQNYLIFNN